MMMLETGLCITYQRLCEAGLTACNLGVEGLDWTARLVRLNVYGRRGWAATSATSCHARYKTLPTSRPKLGAPPGYTDNAQPNTSPPHISAQSVSRTSTPRKLGQQKQKWWKNGILAVFFFVFFYF
jgi:hypothetical protein